MDYPSHSSNTKQTVAIISLVLFLIALPVGLILVKQRTQLGSDATGNHQQNLQCQDIKLYTESWQSVSFSDVTVGQTIYITIKGTTNHPDGVSKARFSFDNQQTWQETSQKNSNDEFYIQYIVPDEASIAVIGQVYNSTLGWR